MDWHLMLSTFGILFLAELGDKTQLAVITQVCRYRRPAVVFAAATLALALVTALGVVAGQVVGQVIPEAWIRWLAGAGFVLMGGWMFWKAWKDGRQSPDELCELEDPAAAQEPPWRAFVVTFGLLALAEMGDKTQLAVLTQASHTGSPWAVFGGAALALAGVTALGAICGYGLVCLIPERWIRRAAALAFVVMGALIGLGVL